MFIIKNLNFHTKTFIWGICFLAILGGCNFLDSSNDEPKEEDEPENEYTFKINGEEWPAVSPEAEKKVESGQAEDVFSIVFTQSVLEEIHYIQKFTLTIPFDGEGTYSLNPHERETSNGRSREYGGRIYALDHDVTISFHDPIPDSTNQVTITRYDEENQVIEGTWQGSFARRDYERDEFEHLYRLPDTVHVTDGEFKLYYEDFRD